MIVALKPFSINNYIQVSASMQGQSLSAVSDSLLEAGDFVKEIQSDERKLDCLRVFASSLNFVEWLRKETRSIICLTVFFFFLCFTFESPIQVLMISTTL